MVHQLTCEALEGRRLLSFTAASDPPGAGGTVALATFTGNGAGDVIIFDRVEHAGGARLRHNRVSFAGDGGFVSDLDFDSARPGEQVMFDLPANRVIVNAGGGDDTMRLGHGAQGAAPFASLNARFELYGQAGNDTIDVFDLTGSSAQAITLDGQFVSRAGGIAQQVRYDTGSEQLFVYTAGLADMLTVSNTNTVTFVTLHAGGGADAIFVDGTSGSRAVQVVGGTGLDHLNVNTDGTGAAAVQFGEFTEDFATVALGTGGHARIPGDGTRVLRTQALSMPADGSARLDLTNNVLIIDYAGASPLLAVDGLLRRGHAGGAWTGGGITSGHAAITAGLGATQRRALGLAEASEVFATFPATFAGQTVDNSALLVRYTAYGDANLDRTVNLVDFNRLASSFGVADPAGVPWSRGDFNLDDAVNLQDFNLLAGMFGMTVFGPEDELSEPTF